MNDSNTPDSTIQQDAMLGLLGGANADLLANPFPLFAVMRSMGAVMPIPFPIMGTDRQAWAVTHMDVAAQVLKDHAHFTVDADSIGVEGFFGPASGATDSSDTPTFFNARTMLTVDEPDHRRLRGLVSKVFTPRYIESLRPSVRRIADELLDGVQAQGRMDLVADYAFPLPINVISDMLGAPRADRDKVREWSGALAAGQSLGGRDPEITAHMQAFGAYTARLVADKRQHPADDLISQLIAIEEEGGDRLSEAELLSMITLLIFAGHETTSNLIGSGALILLDHPEQLAKIKADLSLVPTAVEELLRFSGPATIAGPRFATQDIELAGQQIKKGDIVIPFLLSADHDESQFTQPDELDIARKLSRHLAFGHGIHMCLGAPLARLEGDIAFTTLLKRMPDLRLDIPRERITWQFSLNSRSLAALPVAF